eukprot:gb/GECH01011465.1/.p1 GENE.gb/GECH01011465.1/~~gb/GECH01011465.1/.p1  ORF type:complete len:111 (+),score=17.59 gb/GECH01011465.1/:1-333(+)
MVNKDNPRVYEFEAETDKDYFFCSCGRSSKLPLCDGSHAKQNTPYKPVGVTVDKNGKLFVNPKKAEIMDKETQAKIDSPLTKDLITQLTVGAVAVTSIYVLSKLIMDSSS